MMLASSFEVERCAAALVEALKANTPYFEEAGDAYREHVEECAQSAVDECVEGFEPEPYEEWCASGESLERRTARAA